MIIKVGRIGITYYTISGANFERCLLVYKAQSPMSDR